MNLNFSDATDGPIRLQKPSVATGEHKVAKPISILVVEDHDDIRNLTVLFLAQQGFDTHGAENGRVALEKIRQGLSPSLILLDLMMPVMDGRTFLERLAIDHPSQKIPVFLVSADVNVDRIRHEGLIVETLKKPVDIFHLLNKVLEHTRFKEAK